MLIKRPLRKFNFNFCTNNQVLLKICVCDLLWFHLCTLRTVAEWLLAVALYDLSPNTHSPSCSETWKMQRKCKRTTLAFKVKVVSYRCNHYILNRTPFLCESLHFRLLYFLGFNYHWVSVCKHVGVLNDSWPIEVHIGLTLEISVSNIHTHVSLH